MVSRVFPFWLHHFLTLSTLWKEMGIVEKEGNLLVFDADNLKKNFITAEIIARRMGKISAHLPAAEGLR